MLYNFDPLKSHFYIVKLGFTGVYIIFLIFAQKHRLRVLVRTASLCLSRNMKSVRVFYLKIFSFWRWNFRRVFVVHLRHMIWDSDMMRYIFDVFISSVSPLSFAFFVFYSVSIPLLFYILCPFSSILWDMMQNDPPRLTHSTINVKKLPLETKNTLQIRNTAYAR